MAADQAIRESVGVTFAALLARDMRVLRQDAGAFAARIALQPVMFVFLFSYVLPETGGALAPGRASFSTILVPGLVASSVFMAGLMAVCQPLMIELSYSQEITDRLLAPVPTWLLGVQKILSGALQAVVGGALVFPVAYFLHAPGQPPDLDVRAWPLLIAVIVLGSAFTASLGLLAGTVIDPRKTGTLLTVLVMPATFLGCVFYPWSALDAIPWLQVVTLLNPLAYVSEGLRAALTPAIPHMPTPAILLALTAGTAGTAVVAVWAFIRKAIP